MLKDALSLWTNRVIAVKLRELEVVQQKDRAIVLYVSLIEFTVSSLTVSRAYRSAFCKWKKVCIRHVEELSLMESYQDVKREGIVTFLKSSYASNTSLQRTCVACSTSGLLPPAN
jgi:protein SFI1